MSRVIKNDHPWTEDEIAYQLSRSREAEVEKNRKDFPPGSESAKPDDEPVKLELDEDIYDFVQGLDLDGLKDNLRKRDLSAKGDEVELKVRLAQHLQSERESNADSGSN